MRALIHLYRWLISPLNGPCCRYQPTCSAYALEALDKHGLLMGSALTLKRLLRCHPFTRRHGYDPVPETLPRPFAFLHKDRL